MPRRGGAATAARPGRGSRTRSARPSPPRGGSSAGSSRRGRGNSWSAATAAWRWRSCSSSPAGPGSRPSWRRPPRPAGAAARPPPGRPFRCSGCCCSTPGRRTCGASTWPACPRRWSGGRPRWSRGPVPWREHLLRALDAQDQAAARQTAVIIVDGRYRMEDSLHEGGRVARLHQETAGVRARGPGRGDQPADLRPADAVRAQPAGRRRRARGHLDPGRPALARVLPAPPPGAGGRPEKR